MRIFKELYLILSGGIKLSLKYVYCCMNLKLILALLICSLWACQSKPDLSVETTQLQWPLLEELSEVRTQLIRVDNKYYIATEDALYELADTLPDTEPRLLHRFDGTYWDSISKGLNPDIEILHCRDLERDFVNVLPDFYMHRMDKVDDQTILVSLAYNFITHRKNEKGYGLNKAWKMFLIRTDGKLEGPLNFNYAVHDTLDTSVYNIDIGDYSASLYYKTDSGLLALTKDVNIYETPTQLKDCPQFAWYNLNTGNFMLVHPDSCPKFDGSLPSIFKNQFRVAWQEGKIHAQQIFSTPQKDSITWNKDVMVLGNQRNLILLRNVYDYDAKLNTVEIVELQDEGKENLVFHFKGTGGFPINFNYIDNSTISLFHDDVNGNVYETVIRLKP